MRLAGDLHPPVIDRMTRISWIKPCLLLCASEFFVLRIWNGAFEMDKSGWSLTWAEYIHFASVDKQTPSRVDEGIIVDIRKNTNHSTIRKDLLWTYPQFEPFKLIKVTQHDSKQE